MDMRAPPVDPELRREPDVSVIIPLFNRARLIEYTLESLARERHPGVELEVIVIDDGSTDESVAVAQRSYTLSRLLRTSHRGAGAARNTGLEVARAPTVLFLDSDDLVEAGFFTPRLTALARHPEAAGAYGPSDSFESEGHFDESLVRPRHAKYPLELQVDNRAHLLHLLGGWYITPCTILWRTRVLREVGGHDEGLRINQDVELLFRILTGSAGLVGCSGPRALSRDHTLGPRQGAVADDERKAAGILSLRRRFIARLTELSLDETPMREALARYCLDRWLEFRGRMPAIAEEFYELSRSLYPELQIDARPAVRLLAAAVGPRRAALIANTLRELRNFAQENRTTSAR